MAVEARSSNPGAQNGVHTRHIIGSLLCRVVVPLWVLAGAAFKLYERNPGNLPSVIRDMSKSAGLGNLDTLLRVLIGLEFFAVAVMLLMPRFARAMAIFMLVCFCAILAGEIATGAATCGCFGSLPMKPWHMLVIDGTLLLLVIAFPSRTRTQAEAIAAEKRGGNGLGWLAAMIALLTAGMTIAVAIPNPPARTQEAIAPDAVDVVPPSDADPPATVPHPSESGMHATQPNASELLPEQGTSVPAPPVSPPPSVIPATGDPTINPAPSALPASWYTQKMEEWVGKPWRELEIFKMMPRWPRQMDTGPRYIVFYSRTCDHCKTMLEVELVDPLDGLTTLVEVPASRTLMTDPNGWEMPMSVDMILGAELLQLPLGPNWIITTPLIIKVVDGKVVCATEGSDHKKCLGIP